MAGRKKKTEEITENIPTSVGGKKVVAFSGYDEYMRHIFHCVNMCLAAYMDNMKLMFSNGQGGYKNVLYPDLEVASDSCNEQLIKYEQLYGSSSDNSDDDMDMEESDESNDGNDEFDDELLSLLGAFAESSGGADSDDEGEDSREEERIKAARDTFDVVSQLEWISACGELTLKKGQFLIIAPQTKHA